MFDVTIIAICCAGLLFAFFAMTLSFLPRRNTGRRLMRFSLSSLFFLITAIGIALGFSRSAFFGNNVAMAVIGFPYLLFLLLVIRMAYADIRALTRGGEHHSSLHEFRRRQLDDADNAVAHLDAFMNAAAPSDAVSADPPATTRPLKKWWLKRWENRYHPSNPGVDHGQD